MATEREESGPSGCDEGQRTTICRRSAEAWILAMKEQWTPSEINDGDGTGF